MHNVISRRHLVASPAPSRIHCEYEASPSAQLSLPLPSPGILGPDPGWHNNLMGRKGMWGRQEMEEIRQVHPKFQSRACQGSLIRALGFWLPHLSQENHQDLISSVGWCRCSAPTCWEVLLRKLLYSLFLSWGQAWKELQGLLWPCLNPIFPQCDYLAHLHPETFRTPWHLQVLWPKATFWVSHTSLVHRHTNYHLQNIGRIDRDKAYAWLSLVHSNHIEKNSFSLLSVTRH